MKRSMKSLQKIVLSSIPRQYELCSVQTLFTQTSNSVSRRANIEEKRHEELKTAKRWMRVLLCINKIFRFRTLRNWVLVKHRDLQAFHTHPRSQFKTPDFTKFKIEFRNHVSCT